MADAYNGTGDVFVTWSDTTADMTTTWSGWSGNTADTDAVYVGADPGIPFTPPTPTRAQMRRSRLINARGRGEQRRKRRQEVRAEKKAKRLLMALISKADYKQFLSLGYLVVEGRSGKVYHITPGEEIEIMQDGLCIESLCIVTSGIHLPAADEVAWKKLLIEADEDRLLEVANHTQRS